MLILRCSKPRRFLVGQPPTRQAEATRRTSPSRCSDNGVLVFDARQPCDPQEIQRIQRTVGDVPTTGAYLLPRVCIEVEHVVAEALQRVERPQGEVRRERVERHEVRRRGLARELADVSEEGDVEVDLPEAGQALLARDVAHHEEALEVEQAELEAGQTVGPARASNSSEEILRSTSRI